MRTDKGCPDRTLKAAKQDSEILREEDLDEDLDRGDEDEYDTDFHDDNGANEGSYATAADGEDRDEVDEEEEVNDEEDEDDDEEDDVDAVNVTMLMWLWIVGWYATNHMSIQPHGWYATSEGE